MPAPDLAEPVIGYRAWCVDPGGSLVPWAATAAGAWIPGINSAQCLRSPTAPGHKAPAKRCTCGLYALASPNDHRLDGEGQAVGAIVAWGAMEVYETGFRAESAVIVALSLPEACPAGHLERLKRAARRYGVPLVPRGTLPVSAAEFGRPLDWRRLSPAGPSGGPSAAPDLEEVGRVGVSPDEHLLVRIGPGVVSVHLTPEVAREIRGRPFVVPEAGTEIQRRDVLVQAESGNGPLALGAPLSGYVVSPGDGTAPDYHLVDLAVDRWEEEATALRWGSQAMALYSAEVMHAAQVRDPFLERRTAWRRASAGVESPAQVLSALRALRLAGRFSTAEQVETEIAQRLRRALSSSAVTRHVSRMPVRVCWRLHDPDVDLLIDLTDAVPTVSCGTGVGPGNIVMYATAHSADRYFSGRLDLPAALRRREIQSSAPLSDVLLIESVLKVMKASYAALVSRQGEWTPANRA